MSRFISQSLILISAAMLLVDELGTRGLVRPAQSAVYSTSAAGDSRTSSAVPQEDASQQGGPDQAIQGSTATDTPLFHRTQVHERTLGRILVPGALAGSISTVPRPPFAAPADSGSCAAGTRPSAFLAIRLLI